MPPSSTLFHITVGCSRPTANQRAESAGADDLENEKAMDAYVKMQLPSLYDDFLGTAKSVLTERHREALRRLLTFRFKRHPRYNLSEKRLCLIEKEIQKRAGELLN